MSWDAEPLGAPRLVADYRERFVLPALKKLDPAFVESRVDSVNLEVGDFLITQPCRPYAGAAKEREILGGGASDTAGGGAFYSVLLGERKDANDLGNSLTEADEVSNEIRWDRQKIDMAGFCANGRHAVPFLIIEDFEGRVIRREHCGALSEDAAHTLLLNAALLDGFHVAHTRNPADTASFLQLLYRYVAGSPPYNMSGTWWARSECRADETPNLELHLASEVTAGTFVSVIKHNRDTRLAKALASVRYDVELGCGVARVVHVPADGGAPRPLVIMEKMRMVDAFSGEHAQHRARTAAWARRNSVRAVLLVEDFFVDRARPLDPALPDANGAGVRNLLLRAAFELGYTVLHTRDATDTARVVAKVMGAALKEKLHNKFWTQPCAVRHDVNGVMAQFKPRRSVKKRANNTPETWFSNSLAALPLFSPAFADVVCEAHPNPRALVDHLTTADSLAIARNALADLRPVRGENGEVGTRVADERATTLVQFFGFDGLAGETSKDRKNAAAKRKREEKKRAGAAPASGEEPAARLQSGFGAGGDDAEESF